MNMSGLALVCCAIGLIPASFECAGRAGSVEVPENLATRARIRADSEYSAGYRAQFVADGKIPEAGSKDDVGQAWCVKGATHRQGAALEFAWQPPVTVAEILYYGRTAWFMEECWKDFEVLVDDSSQPVLQGRLEKSHGPQRIRLPGPTRLSRLTLRFTSSYDGPNPGASEVQIFGARLSDAQLRHLARTDLELLAEVDCLELRRLIVELQSLHGPSYPQAAAHLARLEQLEARRRAGESVEEELSELQRRVLLFDVERLLAIRRHEIDATHVYTYHNEGFRAGGGLCLVDPHTEEAAPVELVASPTGQILDCDLSYDGQVVLFSWRQREDEGYHLWRINIDGTGLRQLTAGEWHDYNGCWLPDGGIAFVSTRSAQFAYCWNSPVGVVHRMNADGSGVERLSANYLNDFTPYPLEDGRIIFSRWEYVDRPAIPIQSLWTINPDGTGLEGYYGNRVISPGTFMEARSVPGSTRIVCTMTGHNGPARGAIGMIDRTRGPNAQQAIWNLTPDVPVPAVDQGSGNFDGGKWYSSPVPLDAARFLVSRRGPVLARTYHGTCQTVALPRPADGLQWFGTQPVRARRPPPVLPSVRDREAGTSGKAYLFVQDVCRGLEGSVKRGEITHLRVVREMPKTVRIDPDRRAFGFQFPVISAGATYAAKDVIGEVVVEPDGSASFEVPAGVPLYLMALDAQGRAVQRMRSFTHLMPGEVQGCVGCHASRSDATPLGDRATAVHRSFKPLTPPEWGPGGFDYAAVVQPVLDRHCQECHSGVSPAGEVDLSGDRTDFFNVSYETLARGRRQAGEAQWESPYVSWIPSYNGFEANILQVTPKSWGSPRSKLADLLLSGHPDQEGRPRVQLDQASVRRVLAWIDLNVPYYGTSETTHPDNRGSRRIYPADLDRVLQEVAGRRCSGCHEGGKVPRPFWTRLTHPELNAFLAAPLAEAAGGSGKCRQAVFASPQDADYQAILRTFDPVLEELERNPRMDMPGAKASLAVNRSCQ